MKQNTAKPISRRRFLKTAGATALAAGAGPAIIIPSRAQPKTLKILRYKSFQGRVNQHFDEFAKAWGEQNDTQVMVDFVGLEAVDNRAAGELAAQQGHDLVLPLTAPAPYEDQVIDHREIYEECERRYGKVLDLAVKSTYNPRTKKFGGVCEAWLPFVIHYRKDLWDAVGMVPDTWEDIRRGGGRINLLHEHPVGISLGTDIDANNSVRTVLYSFGASVQDADDTPALKSRQTLEALKFFKALFEQTMTEEVLTWDVTSNNRFMLAGEGSLTLNSLSVIRGAERLELPVSNHILLEKIPQGPVQRIGPDGGVNHNFIWKFAENIEGAKQFLVDYIGKSRDSFLATSFAQFPCFPQTVPDLLQLLANDSRANPPDKYKVLASTLDSTTNIGYPGYANAAISEIMGKGLVPTMFAQTAFGKMTPDEALGAADREVRRIFEKWQERGKV